MQAAAREIGQRGIAALDLDDVAADLGVAPEAVRYWFQDETEALISIMQIRQRWFLDEADARLAALPTHTGEAGRADRALRRRPRRQVLDRALEDRSPG